MDSGASMKKISWSASQLVGLFPSIISWDSDTFLTAVKISALFAMRLRLCGQIWSDYKPCHAPRPSGRGGWAVACPQGGNLQREGGSILLDGLSALSEGREVVCGTGEDSWWNSGFLCGPLGALCPWSPGDPVTESYIRHV